MGSEMCIRDSFNIGLFLPAIIYSILINPQRVSIAESPFFNYKGANNTIYTFLPIAAMLILVTGQFIVSLKISFIIIGLSGLCGILLHRQWINLILKKFNRNQYKIAANLRGEYS